MNKWLPLIITVVFAAWIAGSARAPKDTGFAIREFGKLPILNGGRRAPDDLLARNSLLPLRGKQTAHLEPWKAGDQGPKIISAAEWLVEGGKNPPGAPTRAVF